MKERKTYTIDVSKRPLGRVATEIAVLLMGKNEETYKANEDKGGYVVVKNVDQITVTGSKKENKRYYHHTGYPGGLKAIPYEKMADKKPGATLKKAVYGMLPKNKLRVERIKRLKID